MNQPLQGAEFVGCLASEIVQRYSHRTKELPTQRRPIYYYFSGDFVPSESGNPTEFDHAVKELLLRAMNVFGCKCDLVIHSARQPNDKSSATASKGGSDGK